MSPPSAASARSDAQQRGLADPRRAFEHEQPALTARRGLEKRLDRRLLGLAFEDVVEASVPGIAGEAQIWPG